jgi:transcription antitermination factor NusG
MDVESKVDTVEEVDSGLTSSTIPGRCERNAQDGVSVENVPEPRKGYEWYVFRVSYSRISKVRACLDILESSSYVPYHTVHVMKNGKRRRVIQPLISGIIFVYLTCQQSRLYTKGPKIVTKNDADKPLAPEDKTINNMFVGLTTEKRTAVIELTKLISYYYNHFETDSDGKNPPLIIPYPTMSNFINGTHSKKGVKPLKEGTFTVGDEVEVIEGEFKGLRGRVINENKHKKKLRVQMTGFSADKEVHEERGRIYMSLPLLGSFGSAYIPTAYFKKTEAPTP